MRKSGLVSTGIILRGDVLEMQLSYREVKGLDNDEYLKNPIVLLFAVSVYMYMSLVLSVACM